MLKMEWIVIILDTYKQNREKKIYAEDWKEKIMHITSFRNGKLKKIRIMSRQII